MFSEPLVSVGIVTYKRPEGLKKTINKICNQTHKNLQIIISDDDPEGKINEEIVNYFIDRDKRIKYSKLPINSGMNINFSNALSHAEGKYFMWAADDDSWDEDFIEKCIRGLEENNNSILCITNTKFIDQNYKVVGEGEENIHTVGLTNYERFKKYFRNSKVHNVGFYGIYKSEYLKKAYLPNFQSNDRLVMLELSLKGEFIQLDEPGFYYNISGSSKGMGSYLKAMKLNSKIMEIAPHITFNYIHVISILFKWRGVSFLKRFKLLRIYYQLIKENGYYKNSKIQFKRLSNIALNKINPFAHR